MVNIRTFRKTVPSVRHKKIISIKDNTFMFLKKQKAKHNNNFIKRKKKLYTTRNINLNINLLKNTSIITKSNVYQFKPYKKIINCQTLSGFNLFIPGVELLNIGKVLYNYRCFLTLTKNFFFIGFIAQLRDIPYTVVFSNVTNNNNNKITYARSSGTYCKLTKMKKTKKKLTEIILPSGTTSQLGYMSKAYIGKNFNFEIPRLVEGKYGFGFHKCKNIKVRGVAMNPVDHPNGGRTKTVQPERSPWNWVAKKKK